jgi:hypothetical protein
LSPESSWLKVWRRCRRKLRVQCRQTRAFAKACSRDNGYCQGKFIDLINPSSSNSYSRQDPYIRRNHLGSFDCLLCSTLHTNEGSYLAHTQGRKHQTNLARRAARDAKNTELMFAPAASMSIVRRKAFLKIGRPAYRVTKIRDSDTGKEGMMVQVHLPHIKAGVLPKRRFMSVWEQRKERPDTAYQYLIARLLFRLFVVAVAHTMLMQGGRRTVRNNCFPYPCSSNRERVR